MVDQKDKASKDAANLVEKYDKLNHNVDKLKKQVQAKEEKIETHLGEIKDLKKQLDKSEHSKKYTENKMRQV